MNVLAYRARQVKEVPRQKGVYALCDLDNIPIYVGCSHDGIQNRVRRHLTSARSDIIANRLIDVWELAYVRSWPIQNTQRINRLEAYLFHRFHARSKLMNGTIPRKPPARLDFRIPEPIETAVLPDDEREMRRQPIYRFPRQIEHLQRLVDQILIVKDSSELHRALAAHFQRLRVYYNAFIK